MKGTYYNQGGTIQPQGGDFESVDETFWIVDALLSYRLPKRFGFIAVGVTNLLDEDFRYQDTDPNNPAIQPVRTFFAKLTLALP
jgi:outer membrane receptor for monomeric catechols